MKKIVGGGFLSLIGSIWTLAIVFLAEKNLVSSWTSFPGRFLTTVSEMGLMLIFAISVLMLIAGVALMIDELLKKEK